MELNKNIENQIKNQLNSRLIEPSTQAWNRLEFMLGHVEKPKKKLPWLLIAASFIGFMFFGSLIFKLQTVTLPVVEMQRVTTVSADAVTSSSADYFKNKNGITSIVGFKPRSIALQNNINLVINRNQKSATSSQKVASNTSQLASNIQQESKSGVSINNQNQIISNYNQDISNQIVINQQTANQQMPTKNENEILASVKTKETAKTALKLNITALLAEVDGAVNNEYKENVFTKVAKNFQTLRITLSDRNNAK